MPLSVGDRLGPYEILAPIGAGGMGEVYKARDTRLGRDVAVKISAGQLTAPKSLLKNSCTYRSLTDSEPRTSVSGFGVVFSKLLRSYPYTNA